VTTRWKLTIEYDGSGFSGWQRQLKDVSVQEAIETAIAEFSGEAVRLHASGRTDAGVHALAQVAHFDLDRPTTGPVVRDALNYYLRFLPVAILDVAEASPDFHARFSALSRSYRYRILNRKAPAPLEVGRAWHVPKMLDVGAMQTAADLLVGTHDFSTFRAAGCQSNSPLKTLSRIDVRRVGDLVTVETDARSFLYHQVRNMVGSLSLVGTGRWTVDDFAKAFAARTRAAGGPTAPPEGLYFLTTRYSENVTS
jgi:tRNA pseudouridine38-40 synthase